MLSKTNPRLMAALAKAGLDETYAAWARAARVSPAHVRAIRCGRRRLTGRCARALAKVIGVAPWWSPHVWTDDYRKGDRWERACGIGIHLDYYAKGTELGKEHSAPPEGLAEQLDRLFDTGTVPVSIAHATPRGHRAVVLFTQPVTDATSFKEVATRVGKAFELALKVAGLLGVKRKQGTGIVVEREGYIVDRQVLTDTARFLFAPSACVGGETRRANILMYQPHGYDLDDLRGWSGSVSANPTGEAHTHVRDQRFDGNGPLDRLLGALAEQPGAKARGDRITLRCLFHEPDNHPSAVVFVDGGGYHVNPRCSPSCDLLRLLRQQMHDEARHV